MLSVDLATQVTISANATVTGSVQAVRFRGIALACFGDDPSALLSGHRILAGNIFNNSTFIYSVDTNSWTQAATKVYADRSDEEGWTMLSGGSVLTYDLFQSGEQSGLRGVLQSCAECLDADQSRRRLGQRNFACSDQPRTWL